MRPSIERLACYALCCAVATSLAACAASPRASVGTVETPPRHDRAAASGSNVLDASEIAARDPSTAYDAIVSLRPRFLNARQPDRLGRAAVVPSVVIEKGFPESPAVLKSIRASEVAEVRFLEPWESTTRFGPEYVAGMILVRLRALHQPTPGR